MMEAKKVVSEVAYYGRLQDTAKIFCVLTGRGDGDSLDYGYHDSTFGWTKSSQDGGCRWFDDGAIKKDDIPILLTKFGLNEVRDARLADFETIRYLSPAELIKIRRTWEEETDTPRCEVVSDRAGGHISADMFIEVMAVLSA